MTVWAATPAIIHGMGRNRCKTVRQPDVMTISLTRKLMLLYIMPCTIPNAKTAVWAATKIASGWIQIPGQLPARDAIPTKSIRDSCPRSSLPLPLQRNNSIPTLFANWTSSLYFDLLDLNQIFCLQQMGEMTMMTTWAVIYK